MEKDEKTTSDYVNCKENAPTSMNVGRLTPDMIQACGVQGAVWMMIIDKRHQRHFWAAEGTFEDPQVLKFGGTHIVKGAGRRAASLDYGMYGP